MENNTEAVESTEVEGPASYDDAPQYDNHEEYEYGDYEQDNFDVPTDPDNEFDEQIDAENEEIDYDQLNEMMTDYMREKFELPDKFKDIGSLINSYKHLESRLGGMKGAPETYELDEAIFDSYDEDMLQEVTSAARELGIDNDAVNNLLGKAAQAQSRIAEANWEMELNKLGPNARETVAKDIQYLNANFAPEVAQTLQSMVQTADQYQALHSLVMDHRIGGNPAPAANTPTAAPVSQQSVDQMLFAKDEFGNLRMETDSAYANKVMGMMNQLHGSGY